MRRQQRRDIWNERCCCAVLPRTDQGDDKEYIRHNGPYTLGLSAGIKNKLPYGNMPRLLLVWACTEAVRTGSRKLVMGSSLSDFLRGLGIQPNGSSRKQVQEQMMRLLGCTFTMIYQDDNVKATENVLIGRRTHLWRTPNQAPQWDSTIELTQDFFNEICSHPVPVDLNILTALKRSSLGLDVYVWLTYRVHMLNLSGDPSLALSWPLLYKQFGAAPDNASHNGAVQSFRLHFERELEKIKQAWPELNCHIERGHRYKKAGGVVLLPSKPSIQPVEQAKLTSGKQPAAAVEVVEAVEVADAGDPWKDMSPELAHEELLAVVDGERESYLSWRHLLEDLKARGLTEGPCIAVGDRALGFWKALREAYPRTREQQCWVHKTAHVLDKLPKGQQPDAKQMIHDMYLSPTKKEALAVYQRFLDLYEAKYPKACECLRKDEDVLFTFYDFPADHWAHLRTTNPIESTFSTVRHRTRQTKGCGSRIAALTRSESNRNDMIFERSSGAAKCKLSTFLRDSLVPNR